MNATAGIFFEGNKEGVFCIVTIAVEALVVEDSHRTGLGRNNKQSPKFTAQLLA
jgi:hypothetical protein